MFAKVTWFQGLALARSIAAHTPLTYIRQGRKVRT